MTFWKPEQLGVDGRVLPVVTAPAAVLGDAGADVDPADPAIVQLAADLVATMRVSPGCVGLAAPQVGLSQRLLVYRVGHEAPLIALVNPEIEWSSEDEEAAEEGCLSIPGVGVDVDRAVYVRVAALDEFGEPRTVEASGLEARVIQHEIDHLDGVLILDRTTREQRKEAIRTLREREREEAEQAA